MELAQHLLSHAVAAPVFRAIGQIRAVGSDTGQAEGIHPPLLPALALPPVFPDLVEKLHGADNEGLRLGIGNVL